MTIEDRPGLSAIHDESIAWPLSNVWLGVTAEDQRRADERIPILVDLPAAVHYVSYEPACSAIDFTPWLARLGWLIAGGESGPGASPSHPDWFRSARDQCTEAGVAFFFKQWGEWAPAADVTEDDAEISRFDHREWVGCSWSNSSRPMWDQWDAMDEGQCVARIGKKTAGRVLDGRTWDGFPAVSHG
jgi:protein gp37